MFLFIDEKLDVFSKCNKFKKTVECVFKEKTRHLKMIMVVPVYRNKIERWREIKNTIETCRLIHSDLMGLCCSHSHLSFCYMLLFIDEKSDVFSKCTVECVFKEKTGHLKIDN